MNYEDYKNARYHVYYSQLYQHFNMTSINQNDQYDDHNFLVFSFMKQKEFDLFKCFLYSAEKKRYSNAYVKNKAYEYDEFVRLLRNNKLTIEDNING